MAVNKITESLECPSFDVHHFVMYFRGDLDKDESAEISNHCQDCQPCYRVMREVEEIMRAQHQPTRTEQLAFLRNLVSVLWTIESTDLLTQVKKGETA